MSAHGCISNPCTICYPNIKPGDRFVDGVLIPRIVSAEPWADLEHEFVDADCVETHSEVMSKLQDVERRLALQLELTGSDIRRQLVDKAVYGKLADSRLVLKWHAYYSSAYGEWEDAW